MRLPSFQRGRPRARRNARIKALIEALPALTPEERGDGLSARGARAAQISALVNLEPPAAGPAAVRDLASALGLVRYPDSTAACVATEYSRCRNKRERGRLADQLGLSLVELYNLSSAIDSGDYAHVLAVEADGPSPALPGPRSRRSPLAERLV